MRFGVRQGAGGLALSISVVFASAFVPASASPALAATDRMAEAKTALTEALKWFPDLSIEGFVNIPDTNETDRQRLIETMRLAGFPPCAKPEALAGFVSPVRLPECVER